MYRVVHLQDDVTSFCTVYGSTEYLFTRDRAIHIFRLMTESPYDNRYALIQVK